MCIVGLLPLPRPPRHASDITHSHDSAPHLAPIIRSQQGSPSTLVLVLRKNWNQGVKTRNNFLKVAKDGPTTREARARLDARMVRDALLEADSFDVRAAPGSDRAGPWALRIRPNRRGSADVCVLLPGHPRVPPRRRQPGGGDARAADRRGQDACATAGRADRGGLPGRAGPHHRPQHGGARRSATARRPGLVGAGPEPDDDRDAAPRLGAGRLRPASGSAGSTASCG